MSPELHELLARYYAANFRPEVRGRDDLCYDNILLEKRDSIYDSPEQLALDEYRKQNPYNLAPGEFPESLWIRRDEILREKARPSNACGQCGVVLSDYLDAYWGTDPWEKTRCNYCRTGRNYTRSAA